MTEEKAEKLLDLAHQQVDMLPGSKDKLGMAVQHMAMAIALIKSAKESYSLADQTVMAPRKRKQLYSSVMELNKEIKFIHRSLFLVAHQHEKMVDALGHLGDQSL